MVYENEMYAIFYIIFSISFIYRQPVFVSVGLTVENIFSSFLGNETQSFILYQLRRTVATYIVHSYLPLGYILSKFYLNGYQWYTKNIAWQAIVFLFCTIPLLTTFVVLNWMRDGWHAHPIMKKLRQFAVNGNLLEVAMDCDREFRSINKLVIKSSSTTYIIATPNWIFKISPYTIDVAHQTNVIMTVVSADEHDFVPDYPTGAQFLNISVDPVRPLLKSFQIRINSANYQELKNLIQRPIKILEYVNIHLTLKDRFLVAFREQVQLNPSITLNLQNRDECWGCSQAQPNVKLRKTCDDPETADGIRCSTCFCAPMWCVDCIGTWFASRQNENRPDLWMSSKSTCPLCRNVFCVLDVCPIVEDDDNNR